MRARAASRKNHAAGGEKPETAPFLAPSSPENPGAGGAAEACGRLLWNPKKTAPHETDQRVPTGKARPHGGSASANVPMREELAPRTRLLKIERNRLGRTDAPVARRSEVCNEKLKLGDRAHRALGQQLGVFEFEGFDPPHRFDDAHAAAAASSRAAFASGKRGERQHGGGK